MDCSPVVRRGPLPRVFAMFAAVATLLVAGVASAAPTESFTSASANLPGDIEIVASSNVKTVRSTDTFKKLLPEVLKMAGKANEGIEKVKKTCGIDPITAFDDLTIGLDKREKGAVYVNVNGVTEAKLVECLTKIGKAINSSTVTTKKTGNITEVKSDKGSDSLFFAWLTGDILVVATEPDDKALLERMIGGKGALAKSKLATRLGKADSSAALSVVFARDVPVEKMTVKNGDVTVNVAGGNIDVAATGEMATSKEAEAVAQAANKVATMVSLPKNAPKELEKMLKSVSAKASGAEVKITARTTEKDLLTVALWAVKEKFRF